MNTPLDEKHRLGHPLPKKIVLVRSLPGLGDFLCVIPALRALRTALPSTQITMIGLPTTFSWQQQFNRYINEWLEFPGFPGIPEVSFCSQRTISFLTEIQSFNFDLALQMHGNGTHINSFTMLLGAKQTAGFYPPNHSCPDRDRFLPYPEHESEVWRHLRLLKLLGISPQGEQLEFSISQTDWQDFYRLLSCYSLQNQPYICIHPGASTIHRRWSCGRFAKVADTLAAQGFRIVLTGTQAEAELTHTVTQLMRFPAINLAGKTALGTLAALLKKSCLLICNDTGISHLAAALQVNSVVIFTQSDPVRWAPLDRRRHKVVIDSEYNQDKSLVIHQVLKEAIDLLHQEQVYAT
jgi:ADP-heptose:LPS heptosyltransferase